MTPANPDAPFGLYVHIPFCHARCGYCDFVTFTGKGDQRGAYVRALQKEIELYSKNPPFLPLQKGGQEGGFLSTIFLGGGTPSLLEPAHIDDLFSSIRRHLRIAPDAEITLEANPESVDAARLTAWRAAGINRLSFGLQAYDDGLLKSMGRLHNVAQFEHAYRMAKEAGFSNLSIDLIYGLPGQSLDSWNKTLQSTVGLAPEHLSLYALAIEEHTPFSAAGVTVESDLQAQMYDRARVFLAEQGYPQYEISNFARPGLECRHNMIYWRAQNYLGLGVGAVGCVDGRRWENHKNLSSYFKDVDAGRLPVIKEEHLDEPTRRFERLMLGLRLREGMTWPAHPMDSWIAERSRLAAQGCLEEIRPGTWRIADSYVPLTNQILLPFLSA
jgi:oxygen-independent coproporphyrinogen-3 oxidase